MAEQYTFSHTLQLLMQQKNISFSQLASATRSRTTLKALLSGTASSSLQERFMMRLSNSGLFSENEIERLSQATHHFSPEDQQLFQKELEGILTGIPFRVPSPMTLQDGTPLKERLEELKAYDHIDVLCLNCCYAAPFNAFSSLFADRSRDISFKHYVHLHFFDSAPAEMVANVFPLLCDRRYQLFALEHVEPISPHPTGGNLLAIRATSNGISSEMFFVCINDELIFENIHASESQLFAFFSSVLEAFVSQPLPLKEPEPANEDLISLSINFLGHELNRATYAFTSDISLHQIPSDIAIAALREKGLFANAHLDELIVRLLPIHEQRHKNFYCKKKPTYSIITIEGCRRFLNTGYTTDHFYGFRAFTREERIAIFSLILENAESNECFIPLLFKNPHPHFRYHIECYEKLGVSFDLRTTNYDIANGYHSVFLMIPEFTQQYLSFYLHTLVKEKCYSAEKSLALLREMYQTYVEKNEC